jgi:O-antigen ligase
MQLNEQRIRTSVIIDALLISAVPLGLNLLRILDPNGSKLPGIGLLLILIFKNLLLLPGASWHYQKIFHRTSVSDIFEMRILTPLALVLVLWSISVARGLGVYYTFSNVFSNIILLLVGLIAAVTAFLNAANDRERNLLSCAAPAGLVLLVLANILGFAAGLASVPMIGDERLNQTLSLFGMNVGRIYFPLMAGTNTFGSVCALGLLASIAFWRMGGGGAKVITALSVFCCLAALIAVDSRGAMLAVVVALVWWKVMPKFAAIRVLPLGLVLVSPLVPFMLSALFYFVNQQGLFSGLVRSGVQGSKLGVGTGRQYIWDAALDEIANGNLIHLIGYGAFGHVQSKLTSVHNTTLQVFFDMGYVGVFSWICLMCFLVSGSLRLSKAEGYRGPMTVLAASIVYLLIQAQTEVVVTIYTPEIIFYFIMIATAMACASRKQSHESAEMQPRQMGLSARKPSMAY